MSTKAKYKGKCLKGSNLYYTLQPVQTSKAISLIQNNQPILNQVFGNTLSFKQSLFGQRNKPSTMHFHYHNHSLGKLHVCCYFPHQAQPKKPCNPLKIARRQIHQTSNTSKRQTKKGLKLLTMIMEPSIAALFCCLQRLQP